jgi:hypothetical protein
MSFAGRIPVGAARPDPHRPWDQICAVELT